MPFAFSTEVTDRLPPSERCVEDRRNNPVPGRETKFRLLQQNILAYTFPFVPGFATPGINSLSFKALIERAVENAVAEGRHLYGRDFEVRSNAKAKVAGDIFEELEAAVHWNAAARWNSYMADGTWPASPRYSRPSLERRETRQVAVLSLPRSYDWVRLLTATAKRSVGELRTELRQHGLSLPTSTPDIVIAVLPRAFHSDARFRTELPDLGRDSQLILDHAYRDVEGYIEPVDFILAIALKKSLRSDRLYQPLYEANIMQLLLEGRLGASQVDFEVHTLASAGTRAIETYSAASLAGVATQQALPHRAVRDLYEPPTALEVVRRFLSFLDNRMASTN